MGISKRALMEDYYFDELGEVLEQWNALHRAPDDEERDVDPLTFLGTDGEWVK